MAKSKKGKQQLSDAELNRMSDQLRRKHTPLDQSLYEYNRRIPGSAGSRLSPRSAKMMESAARKLNSARIRVGAEGERRNRVAEKEQRAKRKRILRNP